MERMIMKQNPHLQRMINMSQGPAARAMDRLPTVVQETLAKALGYRYVFPELDGFTKCMMAVQLKQGHAGFIGRDYFASRDAFEAQMRSIRSKATAIKQVEDLRLPLQSGTVFARHYHPSPQDKLPMVVFYHGGGFIVGSLDSHDEVCRLLAKHARVQVLSIDYPLAPEASPQRLIKSCEDALAWVYQNRKQLNIFKDRIAVAGDSAGGNIATVVAQRSVNTAYAPHAQFLIYPTVDQKSRHPSYYAYGQGLVLTEDDVANVRHYYVEAHEVAHDDPLVSPTNGVLTDLAPTYLVTAGHDLLHDEGEIYSHKLRQSGVQILFENFVDQTHGFVNLTPISHSAKRHYIHMCKTFRKFWDKNS